MLTVITNGISTAVSVVGSVFSAFFAVEDGDLVGEFAEILPVVGIGIGFYAISRGIGFLKSLVQGY